MSGGVGGRGCITQRGSAGVTKALTKGGSGRGNPKGRGKGAA